MMGGRKAVGIDWLLLFTEKEIGNGERFNLLSGDLDKRGWQLTQRMWVFFCKSNWIWEMR